MKRFKIILYCPQTGLVLFKKEAINPPQAPQPLAFFFFFFVQVNSPAFSKTPEAMCKKTYDPKALTDVPVQK